VPPSHPLQKAMEDWGASIKKASNGTIKYKVFPAQQLGKAFDHYEIPTQESKLASWRFCCDRYDRRNFAAAVGVRHPLCSIGLGWGQGGDDHLVRLQSNSGPQRSDESSVCRRLCLWATTLPTGTGWPVPVFPE